LLNYIDVVCSATCWQGWQKGPKQACYVFRDLIFAKTSGRKRRRRGSHTKLKQPTLAALSVLANRILALWGLFQKQLVAFIFSINGRTASQTQSAVCVATRLPGRRRPNGYFWRGMTSPLATWIVGALPELINVLDTNPSVYALSPLPLVLVGNGLQKGDACRNTKHDAMPCSLRRGHQQLRSLSHWCFAAAVKICSVHNLIYFCQQKINNAQTLAVRRKIV
jgi:hypothetical protein